jgi:hypothetical protein
MGQAMAWQQTPLLQHGAGTIRQFIPIVLRKTRENLWLHQQMTVAIMSLRDLLSLD